MAVRIGRASPGLACPLEMIAAAISCFAETDRRWAVTATLVREGQPILTAISVPLTGETYSAIAGRGGIEKPFGRMDHGSTDRASFARARLPA
jgi:hypothetical protein